MYHHVDQLDIAHSGSPSYIGGNVRRRAHVFASAGNDDVSVARFNDLSGKRNGSQSGSANLVQCHGRNFDRNTCRNRHLSRNILSQTALQYGTEYYFIYHVRRNPGSFNGFNNGNPSQFNSRNIFQRSAIASNGSSGRAYNNNFPHLFSLLTHKVYIKYLTLFILSLRM